MWTLYFEITSHLTYHTNHQTLKYEAETKETPIKHETKRHTITENETKKTSNGLLLDTIHRHEKYTPRIALCSVKTPKTQIEL